ncbi:hypothetical protein BJY01DRAFT_191048 [Aspergillus pseudoustus]|uniref:Secreted protein n=1 Tax=Aspergillus pseudoustus TaxID=1810923 RepID=A0ABR4JUY9_9EURO
MLLIAAWFIWIALNPRNPFEAFLSPRVSRNFKMTPCFHIEDVALVPAQPVPGDIKNVTRQRRKPVGAAAGSHKTAPSLSRGSAETAKGFALWLRTPHLQGCPF